LEKKSQQGNDSFLAEAGTLGEYIGRRLALALKRVPQHGKVPKESLAGFLVMEDGTDIGPLFPGKYGKGHDTKSDDTSQDEVRGERVGNYWDAGDTAREERADRRHERPPASQIQPDAA
jgi:hypothetical protein